MVHDRFIALERFSRGPLRHAETLAQTILQEIILHCDTCNPHLNEPLLDPRIRRAVDHLSKNLSKRTRLPQLALYCGLSVSRFSHLFHRETGKSPGQYQEDLRMHQAMQSLRRTDQRISEISNTLGYDDPLYFSNRFHHYTGMSPRAFRARET
jgi:AraC family transcriptional regulator of arabinose operon